MLVAQQVLQQPLRLNQQQGLSNLRYASMDAYSHISL